MWWIFILAGVTALLVGGLALSSVLGWFETNKTITSDYGELIKERLATGNYRVVGGIFDKKGIRTATKVWETDTLEDDLKEYFGHRNRVLVEL